jgi:translation elongation factor EF-Tu-like GTPase
MSGDWVRVRARIHLLSPDEGGRTSAVFGSYRPIHNFFGPDDREMAMGFIEVPTERPFQPGETREFEILLSTWPTLMPELKEGRTWRIQEGRHLVGTGTILEVLPDV